MTTLVISGLAVLALITGGMAVLWWLEWKDRR